jgi:hypothetical protein
MLNYIEIIVGLGGNEHTEKYVSYVTQGAKLRRRKGADRHGHHIVPQCLGGRDMGIVYLSLYEHIRAHELLAEVFPAHEGLVSAPDLLADRLPLEPHLIHGDEGKLVLLEDKEDPNHIDYSRMHHARCKGFNIWFPMLTYRRDNPRVTPELLMQGIPTNPWGVTCDTVGVRNYLLGQLSL